MELLESQKSSFSHFPRLKVLKSKKFKNHSKPPKLVRQSLFKQFQQKPNIFLVFHWKYYFFASYNLVYDLHLSSNISEMVRVNIAFTRKFFKEYLISFLMIFRLIYFALVMFKVCGITGISKIEFFSFSDEKLYTFFKISWIGTLVSSIGNKIYNNQGLTHNELIAVKLQSVVEVQII